jgi:serine/threonine-protein kinase
VPGTSGADAPDPLVGRILADRYRILTKLGEGAMGAVYLGEHLRMGRRDAIKVLRAGQAQDSEAIARFTRGARNVSGIRHANVCAIYDFSNTEDGMQYLAMEYIEGETLRDTIEREVRLDIRRAVDIACKVADALQAAHDAGVVHRDLKPGNIMLRMLPDGSDAVKVVDFDIAKGPGEPEGAEVTRVGFVVGTPEYMSPEQLTGERLDGRSDLYSLGVVLYRMITGALPFRAVSTQEIMVQRLTTDALRLSDTLPAGSFPPDLEAVLARALARSVDQRQPDAAVFARELRSALQEPAIPTPPAPSFAGPPPTRIAPAVAGAGVTAPAPDRPRRPVRMAISALAAVAILAAGATALLRDRPSESGDPIPSAAAAEAPVADTSDSDIDALASGAAAQDPAIPATEPPTGGEQEADVEPVAPRIGADLGALLDRQLATLSGSPSRGRTLATRDTATLAWHAALTRRDSAAAAFVLAQAALVLGDDAECARWTERGARLDTDSNSANSAWAMLLQVCR